MRYRVWYDPQYDNYRFEVSDARWTMKSSIGDFHLTLDGAVALAQVAIGKATDAQTAEVNREAAEWVDYPTNK